ncbi:MAG: guanitoxin biosynthesis MBL fold metallo-hydrolase GntH [Methanobacteriaceae archaeon]|jgi:ribonuclease Z|nr:guanitoxin biosynthesis MBL fold metallo-hydrolase GntH [Methanobacteriaceae archaeon]MDO9627218.1 guanitoxin biosynthesis MBL fold metallo-hydrolase GntH [Methanobacteriaceae archaeon]
MTNNESTSLPVPAYAGGTKAISLTPTVGTPRRDYAEMFIPGDEELEDGEIRITVLGSGNPWPTRAQASASILVEVGNPERDIFIFDIGTGAIANYASLKLPVNALNKVFITHLHADHTSDLITLSGSLAKVGRADGPVYVWGPSGSEPRLGTKHFCSAIEEVLAWNNAADKGAINPDSQKIVVSEFDFSQTQVVYEANGVKITSFPVVHCISGAVGYRLDFADLSFCFSGDARPSWPLVHACEGGVDLLIHECFPPAKALAAASGLSIERATIAINAAHTSPKAAGKVFGMVKPRMAALWHTMLSPQIISMIFEELGSVYECPVVQTQDLTVFNITAEAVVSRQVKQFDQLPPTPGKQSVTYVPVVEEPPEWWKEALIPLE